ncbi:MAG: ribose 5-phosphate isomerase B [Anaerolineae bacterium]|nr:ribose 5-phosphate isomerase B [Gemmatimonadaceae bacterium]
MVAAPTVRSRSVTRRRVVTERDVRRAAQDGTKTLDARDAVVTPSARDVARALGIELQRVEKPVARGAGGPPQQKVKAEVASLPQPSVSRASTSSPSGLSIALGADHGGVALKDALVARVRELGHIPNDLGTTGAAAVDYPDFAVAVAREVAEGRAQFGIMVDGAGIGSCMAANKVSGVRAAMCYDVTTALNAREHNDANVLTLGGGLIGTRLALAIVEAFLATPFAGGRHAARVAKIDALD